MIRCATYLSSFSSRAFRRSSLRTFSSSGFRSGLRPRFFDRAFSDPLCAALRHVVRCDEVQALSPQELTHLAGLRAPVRFFDETQLVRRTAPIRVFTWPSIRSLGRGA